jgi:hypothetical protein
VLTVLRGFIDPAWSLTTPFAMLHEVAHAVRFGLEAPWTSDSIGGALMELDPRAREEEEIRAHLAARHVLILTGCVAPPVEEVLSIALWLRLCERRCVQPHHFAQALALKIEFLTQAALEHGPLLDELRSVVRPVRRVFERVRRPIPQIEDARRILRLVGPEAERLAETHEIT